MRLPSRMQIVTCSKETPPDMPPKDTCAEHGERLATLEVREETDRSRLGEMEIRMQKLEKIVDRATGAYLLLVALLAFASTIAGNVVSAKIMPPQPVTVIAGPPH